MSDSSDAIKLPNHRITILIIIMLLFVLAVFVRLVYIQVIKHDYYLQQASAQQSRKFILPSKRGEIYVQDGNNELYPIALNQQLFLLAADPKYVKDTGDSLNKISQYLAGIDRQELESRLNNKDLRYVVINKKISATDADNIKQMKLPGIILTPQNGRNYPEGEMFAHITGYVNDDGAGQYGIEQYMNQPLAGTDGATKAITDSLGVPITASENTILKPQDGSDFVLTIDRNLQAIATKAIAAAVTSNRAESGSIVIMDPKTGAIKALVNYPTYDPNSYQALAASEYNKFINSSVSNIFEPGSSFKVITMAAGLDSAKITPDTKYDDTGEVVVGGKVIKNSDNRRLGISTMTDVIQESLNTGVVFVLRQLGTDLDKITTKGKEVLYSYIKKFGFGDRTGIELAGESKGFVKSPDTYDVDYANMAFGQGIAVTSLQLINAVAAIANGGTLYQPYIIDKQITPSGEVKQTKPKVIRDNVISTQSAASLAVMMEQVVQRGSGWPTRMKGYRIAGKTGTAQVPRDGGQGYEDKKNIGTFVGFAPVEDPKFIMLVRVDYPRVDGFAEQTTVPAFAEIAKQLFIYYQLPPSVI